MRLFTGAIGAMVGGATGLALFTLLDGMGVFPANNGGHFSAMEPKLPPKLSAHCLHSASPAPRGTPGSRADAV